MRAALSFLTVLRLGTVDPRALPAAVPWFPVAGALVGIAVAAVDALLSLRLPREVVAPLDLVALALLTGGLHLDGLADTADGLFSGGPRERRLAAMRDPSSGAFGVAAVVLVLLVEAAALARVPSSAPALIGAVVLSRCAMAAALVLVPYARPSGLGTAFRAGSDPLRVLPSVVVAILVALWIGVAAAVALALGVVVAAFARRTLGGLTGDVYGAVGEVVFACVLVMLASR